MRKSFRLSKLSLFLVDLILILIAGGLNYLPASSTAPSLPSSPSPSLPGSPSPQLPVSLSPWLPSSPAPQLPLSQAALSAAAPLAFDPAPVAIPAIPASEVRKPAQEPLRITFPTPGPAPVSALRPALYPIPWALSPYDHFYFSRPIAANEINWPLADYRYGGVFFEDIVHSGVDLQAPLGTPVLAAGPGTVTWAGYGLYYGRYDPADPYGLAVLIRHDFGYQGEKLYTAYGHLNRLDVVKGQQVETGEVIGVSGQTGKATGPHLHFEVRLARDEFFSTRNPELWLVPPQGWGVVAGRVMNNAGVPLESHLVIVRSVDTGQDWIAYTYGGGAVKSDAYYRENMVISDLPAGRYEIEINFWGKNITQEIEVKPGLVSTFSFRGQHGFSLEPPITPGEEFQPPSP